MDYPTKSLLLADDAYFVRHKVRQAVKGLAFGQIYESASGEGLVKKFRIYRPDLVISDIIMEGMNGLEAIRLIFREDPGARIILLSAIDMPQVLHECVDLGIRDFIVKPFKQENLLEAIRQALTD